MNNILSGCQPQSVFYYFETISQIPRGSGNEKAISDYLVSFANERGLWVLQDNANNILIKKPASPGCEDLPAVALQGHLDMVCEKNADSSHDFMRDPISLIEQNGWIRADGTTLGADNGIAVAMMLALLAEDTARHPALECIFTVCEETGLDGAFAFDGSLLAAQYMINLDSEEEGVATVSCCGGVRTHMTKTVTYHGSDLNAVELFVHGLAGGHSGVDIAKNRANAIKLMAALLRFLQSHADVALADISGGNKDNAIPRECKAVVLTARSTEEITALVRRFQSELPALGADDAQFDIAVSAATNNRVMSCSDEIIELLVNTPNGVQTMFEHAPDMVESSCNLASVTMDGAQLRVIVSIRGAAKQKRDAVVNHLNETTRRYGFSLSVQGEYPGWDYERQSHLRDVMSESYLALYGKALRFEAIHAGLECGIFKSKCPQLDIIAIGPNILDCHTPDERLNVASCGAVWQLLLATLAKLCDKCD